MLAACMLLAMTSDLIAPGAKLEKISGGYAFTEGPASDRAGNVYFTDQPNDRIVRWSVEGKLTDWKVPAGRSNGMIFDGKGNLIACADEENQLWSISPQGAVTVLVKDLEGKRLNGPNDVWVRPDGGMYLTDPLYARPYWNRSPESELPGEYVMYLSPDHKTLLPVATDLTKPNGIVGTPDGKTLYVADIGAGKTYRYRIEPSGALGDKTLFCNLGSDGMTMDERGNVYLTGKGVTVFNPAGEQLAHIDVPESWTANVTFGGADHRLLFITASTSVYGLRMSVRGSR